MRVLIADDELLARKRLHRLVDAMDGFEICGECTDGKAVLKHVRDEGADVVLLDINMPGLTGIETLELMDSDGPAVIFCTAHSDHAVQAFDGGATDYLLKPIEPARLGIALERARTRQSAGAPTPPRRLPIPTRRGLVMMQPEAITAAIIDGESVTIYAGGEAFITDFRISELERRLPPELFERVHRKALINLEHIERLEPEDSGGYTAHTRGGLTVSVSRQAARKLRRAWELPR